MAKYKFIAIAEAEEVIEADNIDEAEIIFWDRQHLLQWDIINLEEIIPVKDAR